MQLTIPFYILNTPALVERRDSVLGQLRKHGAADMTFVHCANRQDVASLTEHDISCLHPSMAPTRWTHVQPELATGTLSLAVKHFLAMYDMLQRHLLFAAVLEDDALLHPRFGTELISALPEIPEDAYLYFLGSYSKVYGTFRGGHRDAKWPRVTQAKTEMYVRNNATGILGGLGYIVFERGARALIRPIVAPADIMISLQEPPLYAPGPVYGGGDYIVWPHPDFQGKKAGTHYVGSLSARNKSHEHRGKER